MKKESQWRTSGIVQLTRSQTIGTLVGLMLSMLLAALDQTIVGTAEPKIISSLSGFDRYPWVSTAYLLCSTIAVPIFARLSDIYGRKWFLLGGAGGFVAASALCGAAGEFSFGRLDGMNQLILFRALQGIGGGMMMGLIFTILGDIFSPAERGKYQGVFSGAWGIASVFGPTLGGWLTDSISWRATFYVNLPVGMIAIVALYLWFPYWHPHNVKRRIDWAGTATLIGCIVPLLLAMTWLTQYGWASTHVKLPLAISAVMFVLFLYSESKAEEPLIPLTLFQNRIIAMCSIGVFVVGVSMFGLIVYLPLYLQGVLRFSATRSGNLLTSLLLGIVVGTFLCGQATLRLRSYRMVSVVGSILVAIGTLLLSRVDGTVRSVEMICAMIGAGLGMGLLLPAYTVAVQNAAPQKHMGIATASATFFRSIGSTIGVAIFGSILLTKYHSALGDEFPKQMPGEAALAISNPILLPQLRPSLEAAFKHYENGPAILQDLYEKTGAAMLGGIREIFMISAVLMVVLVVLNLFIEDVPLRHGPAPPPEP